MSGSYRFPVVPGTIRNTTVPDGSGGSRERFRMVPSFGGRNHAIGEVRPGQRCQAGPVTPERRRVAGQVLAERRKGDVLWQARISADRHRLEVVGMVAASAVPTTIEPLNERELRELLEGHDADHM